MDEHAAFWCRIPSRPNFGDALTPWLIRRLSGQYPSFRWADDPAHKYMVTGSVVGLARSKCTVWGAGIMNRDDRLAKGVTLLAVRGPLTRAAALSDGIACPEIYGDPALLLPRLYQPVVSKKNALGLAAHYSDYPRLMGQNDLPPGIRLIDMQSPIEAVIDALCSCRLVAASSLHGLIASHAYGVPAVWVRFKALPSGDGSKFRDYLLSIGRDVREPLQVTRGEFDIERLLDHAIEPPRRGDIDLDAVWRVCPFAGES